MLLHVRSHLKLLPPTRATLCQLFELPLPLFATEAIVPRVLWIQINFHIDVLL